MRCSVLLLSSDFHCLPGVVAWAPSSVVVVQVFGVIVVVEVPLAPVVPAELWSAATSFCAGLDVVTVDVF